MHKSRSLRMFFLLAPVLCLLSGAAPEEKLVLEKTATSEQLVAAIVRNTEKLAEYLSDEKRFDDNLTRDKITAKGGVIAVLAHGLLESKNYPAEMNPVTIQVASQKIAAAESYAEAAQALKTIQSAMTMMKATPATDQSDWYDVVDITNLMEETNFLYQDLKRTVRRSRDPEGDALDAMTVALLAYPLKANLDFALDEADEAEWEKLSQQMHDDFLTIGNAIRAKDTDKARELYETATRSCAACHKKFREQ